MNEENLAFKQGDHVYSPTSMGPSIKYDGEIHEFQNSSDQQEQGNDNNQPMNPPSPICMQLGLSPRDSEGMSWLSWFHGRRTFFLD